MTIRTCVESVKAKRIFSVVVVTALALVLGIALSPQKDSLKNKPNRNNSKDEPAGGNTGINDWDEHNYPSLPAASISLRISATSSAERDFRFVNAAINAGREPSKDSSTTFSLCIA